MNGLTASLRELMLLKAALEENRPPCEVLICPPFTLLAGAASEVKGGFALGGQDCHALSHGAYTGDISAEMLKDAGASHVILGHSERRHHHGETSAQVAAKARAAWRAGLVAIICVGESESERQEGQAHIICRHQLDQSVPEGATPLNTAIAYEPVWAIGSGKTPTASEITAMHAHIRDCLVARLGEEVRGMRILYGGSVKTDNAREILNLPEVNGALVGGASLKCEDFHRIVASISGV